MSEEIKALGEELKKGFKALKDRMKQQDEEIKANGETSGSTKSAIEKIQDSLDSVEVNMKEKLQELETKLNRPYVGGSLKDEKEAKEREQAEVFVKGLRKGKNALTPEDHKTLATDSDPDGGYLIPKTVRAGIIELLVELSPMRQLANTVTLTMGDTYEFIKESSTRFSSGWVGEREARPETTSAKIAKGSIVAHEIYALPKSTQKNIDDTGFDIESWISRKIAEDFALEEGTAFITGNGVDKPLGLLAASVSIGEVNSGHATLITADGLIDLVYDLPEAYAKNGSFMMKRTTVRDIRKLKDTTDQYLWQPGLTTLAPPAILGRPYFEATDMPTIAADSNPVLFGDFRKTYTIVDRQQIRVLRDPFSSKPFIEFYTTARVGGGIELTESMRKLKIAVA